MDPIPQLILWLLVLANTWISNNKIGAYYVETWEQATVSGTTLERQK